MLTQKADNNNNNNNNHNQQQQQQQHVDAKGAQKQKLNTEVFTHLLALSCIPQKKTAQIN
jgi:hypothetical protein